MATVLSQSGCYLAHLGWGQLRVLRAREPVEAILADPATSAELRGQLELVQEVRVYAASLGLSVDGNYTSFAPWPGDRVVTTVVASEPGSVEPAGFWFPLVGSVPYKGFFDAERAEAEAEKLRGRGLDVCVVPVAAYSTLGWFDDPVTQPMLRASPGRLVETLLHELVHATVYAADEADFNEGVASFVGEEASVGFYHARGAADATRRRRLEVEDARRYDAALLAFREQVESLYEREPAGPERDAQRARAEEEARRSIAALPFTSRLGEKLAQAARLNDACLALAATYTGDTPLLSALLDELGGDLAAFVARLREAAERRDDDETLREALLGEAAAAP